MKKNNNKGFTLAELLIVVAIIAVLTAIAIPIFSAQLEKSRQATDLANVRAAYAEATTDALDSDSGIGEASSQPMTQMSETSWDKLSSDTKVGEVTKANLPDVTKGSIVYVHVAADGTVTIDTTAPTTTTP